MGPRPYKTPRDQRSRDPRNSWPWIWLVYLRLSQQDSEYVKLEASPRASRNNSSLETIAAADRVESIALTDSWNDSSESWLISIDYWSCLLSLRLTAKAITTSACKRIANSGRESSTTSSRRRRSALQIMKIKLASNSWIDPHDKFNLVARFRLI